MDDKTAPRKRELQQLVYHAKDRKSNRQGNAAEPRLRPILTEQDISRSHYSRESPKHKDLFTFKRRKLHYTNNASQLDISVQDTEKDSKLEQSMKKLSLVTDNFTPKNFQSVARTLEKRYFTNRSKVDLSPYTQKRNKSSERTESLGKKIRIHTRHSNLSQLKAKVEQLEKEHILRPEVKSSLKPIESKELEEQEPQVDTAASEKKQANIYNLSEKEMQTFGDRFPQKFQKIRILGKGGFSLVWLGVHRKSKKPFAIKQILTKNNHQTHLKEIWFGNFFFEFGGTVREQFSKHPGTDHLIKMYAYDIRKDDTWIFYELCQTTLGCALYSLKPEMTEGVKKYRMTYKHLYHSCIANPDCVKKLIIQMSRALLLLAQHNIVHSDIKTQNILLLEDEQSNASIYKLIDYGSSFLFSNLKQFSMATPQYMAPQILNFILYQNEMKYDPVMLKVIKAYKNESAIDIWSLGCIILQVLNGVPLWLSFDSDIATGSHTISNKQGLFAVKDRNFEGIINKQIQVIKNLDDILDNHNYSGIKIQGWLKEILKGMLSLDPNQRIKPKQILKKLGEPYVFEKLYWESSQQL